MPADSDPTPGPPTPAGGTALPVRFRPFGVRIAAITFGVLLLATVVVVWLTMAEEGRASFTPAQKATVAGMVIGVGAIGHALSRCRIDAEESGLVVVNGYRSHRFAWEQVLAVTLRPGSPWAVLDLADGTSQSALGIQGSDGARARRQTRTLRTLIESHAAVEPPVVPPVPPPVEPPADDEG
jgi:hypothetical protein